MARIQNTQFNNLIKDLYTNEYPYTLHHAQFDSDENKFVVSENYPSQQAEKYRGSIIVPAAMRPSENYALLHSKYIQVGKYENERLDIKLQDYDQILREIYGRTPSELEALVDGRTQEQLAYDNMGAVGLTGIDSLSRIAQILNNRTETIDDRITDLRMFKIVNVTGSSDGVTNLTAVNGTPTADDNGDTLYIVPTNIWIKLAATDRPNPLNNSDVRNEIKVAHLVRAITDDSGSTNFNTNNVDETFVVHTFTYDEAGHIRSKHAHTYTMPKNFKYVAVTSNPVLTNITETTIGTVEADTLTDTLTFDVGNKWICLTTDTNNDKITFKHYVNQVTPTTGTTDFNSNGVTETFDVDTISFDEAGHITARNRQTYTMPKNFDRIITTDTGNAVVADLTTSTGTVQADTLTDIFTLDIGNKWVKIATDTTNDKITLGHLVQSIAETTSNHSFDSSGNTFDVPTLTYDEAGHIRTKNVCTYTIPNSIKGFRVGPSDESDTVNAFSDSDSGMANLAGLYTAGTPRDIMVFTTGNKWIHIARPGAAQIKIAHEVIHNADISVGDANAQTPDFGDTFAVPTLTIDKAGHVTALTDHTVTIPTPSLTDGTGNVMTNLALDASTAALTVTKANVGTLLLADYSAPSVPAAITERSSIAATDSLNAALASLQSYAYDNQAAIEDEISDRAQAIDDLVGTASTLTTLGAIENAISDLNDALTEDVIAAASTAPTVGNLAQWVSETEIEDSGSSINDIIEAAVARVLGNFTFIGMSLKIASGVTWSTEEVDNEYLTIVATPDAEYEGQTITIERYDGIETDPNDFQEADWTEPDPIVLDTTLTDPVYFRAKINRTYQGVTAQEIITQPYGYLYAAP